MKYVLCGQCKFYIGGIEKDTGAEFDGCTLEGEFDEGIEPSTEHCDCFIPDEEDY